MEPVRWGIIATGEVAKNFVQALHQSEDAEVAAVASRTQARAGTFAKRWDIPTAHGSYEALADDPHVDIIYIATPHNLHYENMLVCLQAGKHVLCEKAFTINAEQAAECIALARQKRLFLMEAMWMRFFPAMARVRQWLAEGLLGQVRLVQADFCINVPFDPDHRLHNPNLAGGALLDLGIYPLSLSAMVLGFPDSITSHAQLGPTGVDELDTLLLNYEQGAAASLSCSTRIYKPREAYIVGTEGYLRVHDIFFRPDRLTLHLNGREPEVYDFPIAGSGYLYEIEEVHNGLRAGRTESPLMPLDETLGLMKLMDGLRQDWQLLYPEER